MDDEQNGRRNGETNEACVLGGKLDETQQIEALELAHEFPGYFPIVVIARQDEGFTGRLEALVAELQGAAPHRSSQRSSSRGGYVSYRLELYVDSAAEALIRRASLSEMPGVVMLL